MFRAAALLCLCLLFLSAFAVAGDKKKEPEQLSSLTFTVVKDDNDKPVRNASVILHPVNKDGTQAKGGYQLKTDSDGKTLTEGVPYGKVRIQVIAQGMQTFGNDYDVNQPTVDIVIRLKRPQEQFTIYDKPGSKSSDTGQPQQATPKQP